MTGKVFAKHQEEFKKTGDLSEKALGEINAVFAVPPITSKREKARKIYLECAFNSMNAYRELIKNGAKKSDAIFIIPRAIRIGMVQEYNLFNIIDGYYSLRNCSTADEQIFKQTKEETAQLRKELKKKKLEYLSKLIEPKCVAVGFCPEEESCGYIKGLVRRYDKAFHDKMKEDLENKFQKKLKKVNK